MVALDEKSHEPNSHVVRLLATQLPGTTVDWVKDKNKTLDVFELLSICKISTRYVFDLKSTYCKGCMIAITVEGHLHDGHICN